MNKLNEQVYKIITSDVGRALIARKLSDEAISIMRGKYFAGPYEKELNLWERAEELERFVRLKAAEGSHEYEFGAELLQLLLDWCDFPQLAGMLDSMEAN